MPRERVWSEDDGEVLAFSVGEQEEEWEERWEWECFAAGLGDWELSLSEMGGLGVLFLAVWHMMHLLALAQFSYVHLTHFHFFWTRFSADDFFPTFDLAGRFEGESLEC